MTNTTENAPRCTDHLFCVCVRANPPTDRPKAVSLLPSQGYGYTPQVGVHAGQAAPNTQSGKDGTADQRLHTQDLRMHKSRTQQFPRSHGLTAKDSMATMPPMSKLAHAHINKNN